MPVIRLQAPWKRKRASALNTTTERTRKCKPAQTKQRTQLAYHVRALHQLRVQTIGRLAEACPLHSNGARAQGAVSARESLEALASHLLVERARAVPAAEVRTGGTRMRAQ